IIYGRFGYGVGTYSERWSIDRSRAGLERPGANSGRVRAIDSEHAGKLLPPVLERVVGQRPGMIRRTESMWELRLSDPEHWRFGATPYFYAVHETAGTVDGYVMYRIRRDWKDGFPQSAVADIELIGANSDVEAALWNLCFNIDLTESIEAWNRPVDDPIWWRLADPRRLRRTPRDGLWIRIVDVPKVLSQRRYMTEGKLTLEVDDEFGGWAAGRFSVEGGADGASCKPTASEPDLSLDAPALASLYMGGANVYSLAAAGRIREHRTGALQRAAFMFGWPLAPWCIQDF
ncbi:MAG: sterol carrier protein domain-containing protein, partial [Chloroflexi bacterium]|nr:sterol carrier protein domain-containing protein [Chloroflexota bacterium]